ncbi:hypothetical protein VTH06DRAFT_839 [Thermothelomyces fergusii]
MTQANRKAFANHPGAKEAPACALKYRLEKDTNPPLRGRSLVVISFLVERFASLQRLLWNNAKLGQIKYTPGLDGVAWRIQPDVIPLATSTTPRGLLEIPPELVQPQPADRVGRFSSVADYYELYKSGAATPTQVVEALLPLIERDREPVPKEYAIAFTQVRAQEVLEAAAGSTQRWAQGKPLSYLDGVPFGVKDDVDVEGYVSLMGMKENDGHKYFNTLPERSAWPVKKLTEAGAIMLGKLNQHEIGMDTNGCNPSTGTPRNWYNKSYYPGGSSSGGASALSAGLVPIAIGSDAGGSIRIPAAFCGVYGLKPTHNRVCHMSSSVCVLGPMASTAADLTIAYRIMAQPNPEDPVQSLFAVSTPPEPSAKRYLGVCREWIGATADQDVLRIFDQSLDHLATLGYQVIEIQLPFLREGQLAHSAICLTEAAADSRNRSETPSSFLGMLNYPNRAVVSAGLQTPAVDFLKYGQIRQVIMQHLAFLWEKYPGMMILSPATPMAGWPITEGDDKYGFFDANMSIRNMTFAWLANMSGCPAVSFPAGYIEPKQGEGMLPVGLMATGEWGAEEQLLAFARERECYLNNVYPGGRRRPEQWADPVGEARKWADLVRASRQNVVEAQAARAERVAAALAAGKKVDKDGEIEGEEDEQKEQGEHS